MSAADARLQADSSAIFGLKLGVIGSVFLGLALLLLAIYLYGWLTGQYPVTK